MVVRAVVEPCKDGRLDPPRLGDQNRLFFEPMAASPGAPQIDVLSVDGRGWSIEVMDGGLERSCSLSEIAEILDPFKELTRRVAK